ncbi:MAG: M3 family metallopeptidase [Kiritimatiellia bacterium]
MNPFLAYNELPRYDSVTPQLAEEAIKQLLAEAETKLPAIETAAKPTWNGCMAPRLELVEPLQFAWSIVSHMLNAMNTPVWRQVHETLQPHVVAFFARLGQNQVLFTMMQQLQKGSTYNELTPAQKRILENDLREARHAGAASSPDVRQQLIARYEKNASDSAAFMNHALDASKKIVLTLATQADIAGLPQTLLETASDAARRNGHTRSTPSDGPWIITHEAPLYIPFLQYSERRDLREILYRAYITRASQGDLDNQPILANILKRRRQIANLLNTPTFADLTLEGRMAQSVNAVKVLIERMRAQSQPAAFKEYEILQDYARKHGQTESLAGWDIMFWAERLRKQMFAFDNETLRPYFALPHVLENLFQTVKDLFGVTIIAADGKAPVWHPDVRFFDVQDENQTVIAHLYLDPYSRPESKRGGAWMDSVITRKRMPDGAIRNPAALMVCNQSRPTKDTPSLMTLSEVLTLYHECGHALQHILTTVDEPAASGIHNVEWDAVELPSQFMENWVYHRPFLKRMSQHVQSGSPLPDALLDQVIAARWFMAGSHILRQMFFSAIDIGLHHDYQPDSTESPNDFKQRIAPDYTVIPPLPEDRFLCGFSHIFSGGYAAGYYSYAWADVLAADTFAAFQEAGLDDPQARTETGKRFRNTVLALGGSQHPMEIFKAFRGREPDPDALLRRAGLL